MLQAPRFSAAVGRQLRAERALLDQIGELGGKAGLMILHEQKPWASVTFAGTRHRLRFEFRGREAIAAGENLIVQLPEHEFTIPGQLVADAAVTDVVNSLVDERKMAVGLEILVLDESEG